MVHSTTTQSGVSLWFSFHLQALRGNLQSAVYDLFMVWQHLLNLYNDVNTSGQPIAWAIVDTDDTNSYEEFLKSVKAQIPYATIKTLMTDDSKWYTYAKGMDT